MHENTRLSTQGLVLLHMVWAECFGAEPEVEYFGGDGGDLGAAVWIDQTLALSSIAGRWNVALILEDDTDDEADLETLGLEYSDQDSFDTFEDAVRYAAGAMAVSIAAEAIEVHQGDELIDQLAATGQLVAAGGEA